MRRFIRLHPRQFAAIMAVVGIGAIGSALLLSSHAQTPVVSKEAENGTVNSPATTIADKSASGGQAIKFNKPTSPPPTGNCAVTAILVNPCGPWLGAWANFYPGHKNTGAKDEILNHEARIGRQIQMAKDYLNYGGTLTADAKYFVDRPNTILVTTWKAAPSGNWAAAGGGNATVNANIDAMAKSIKSVAPHKVVLIVWHEPENDVTASTTSCSGAGTTNTSGSPADYVNMWHNIRARFDALGVNNVVWGMNYMLYNGGTCLIKPLWPGNNYVDWVFTDPYFNAPNTNYTSRIDFTYDWLKNNSDATHDFNSKPWGLAEWGVHPTTDTLKCQAFADAKTDLDNNRYPNLKAYIIFDSSAGANGGGIVGLSNDGTTIDTVTQNCYNKFANDPLFSKPFTGLP
ncbi:MAG TPA: hypothetical protein VFH39_00495 [Candidatus Saccharimonadales bacterium]|nr:hypothetical protein [Candidatus Saccharimonadales bacterium]